MTHAYNTKFYDHKNAYICFRHELLMSTSMLKNLIYFMVARPQNVWIHRTSKIRWHALYGILGTVT